MGPNHAMDAARIPISIQGLQSLAPAPRNLALKRTRSLPSIFSYKDLKESVHGTSIRKLDSEGSTGRITSGGYLWEHPEISSLQSNPPDSNHPQPNIPGPNPTESNDLDANSGISTSAFSRRRSRPSRSNLSSSHGTDRDVPGGGEDKMEASPTPPVPEIPSKMYDGLDGAHPQESSVLDADYGSTTSAFTPTKSTSSRFTSNSGRLTDRGVPDTSEEEMGAPSQTITAESASEPRDGLDGRCSPEFSIPNANQIDFGPRASIKHEIRLLASRKLPRDGSNSDEKFCVSGQSLCVEGNSAPIGGTANPMVMEEKLPTLKKSTSELDNFWSLSSIFEDATKYTEALNGRPASFSLSGAASRMDCDTKPISVDEDRLLTPPSTFDPRIGDSSSSDVIQYGTSAYLTPPRPEREERNTPQMASFTDAVAPRPAPPVSGSSSKACMPQYRPEDVIKRVPKPEFPIRARHVGPRTFKMKAQNSKMEWTHDRHHFTPDVSWLVQPDLDHIMGIVIPWLDYLGCEKDRTSISFLVEGGFNKVYAITSQDRMTKEQRQYVFRVTLPIDPWFKTECDVATTEIVRWSTTIPVPKIYAYDSSANNKLGLEWILMERVMGRQMSESWDDLEYNAKVGFTRQIADWTQQLSTLTSKKIGGVYMDFQEKHVLFYVGRSVHTLLNQDGRLLYDINRGPYNSLGDFYEAVLAVSEAEIPVLKWKVSLEEIDNKQPLLERRWIIKPGSEEENWKEVQLKELLHLQTAVEALQEKLLELWELTDDSKTELFTILSHHDISLRNILVDDACKPMALLDWECIQMEPIIFIRQIPEFLQGPDAFDLPDAGPDLHVVAQRHNWSPKTLQEAISNNQSWWNEKMEEYTLTKLRAVYLQEMENSNSSLARDPWMDHGTFDRQLYEHVMQVWDEGDSTHIEWIHYHFDGMNTEEEDEDTDEQDGDTQEDDEEMDSDQGDEGEEGRECVKNKREEKLTGDEIMIDAV